MRSRFIRGLLMDLLWIADGAGIGCGLSFDQLASGIGRSQVDFTSAELRRELNDLSGDRLTEAKRDDAIGSTFYTITSRGRDFKRAGCPFDRVDDFTGRTP